MHRALALARTVFASCYCRAPKRFHDSESDSEMSKVPEKKVPKDGSSKFKSTELASPPMIPFHPSVDDNTNDVESELSDGQNSNSNSKSEESWGIHSTPKVTTAPQVTTTLQVCQSTPTSSRPAIRTPPSTSSIQSTNGECIADFIEPFNWLFTTILLVFCILSVCVCLHIVIYLFIYPFVYFINKSNVGTNGLIVLVCRKETIHSLTQSMLAYCLMNWFLVIAYYNHQLLQ